MPKGKDQLFADFGHFVVTQDYGAIYQRDPRQSVPPDCGFIRFRSPGSGLFNAAGIIKFRQRHDGVKACQAFVAASAVMRKIRAQAELLAKVDGPILILGESGSGKEVAARLIHKISARSGYRFLKVNCAELASDLPENELFGCEGGASIGGTEMNTGRFGGFL